LDPVIGKPTRCNNAPEGTHQRTPEGNQCNNHIFRQITPAPFLIKIRAGFGSQVISREILSVKMRHLQLKHSI
jgi:hypothetical protein